MFANSQKRFQALISLLLLLVTLVPAKADETSRKFLRELDHRFRSSHRYIPAEVLWSQASRAVGPRLMQRLATYSRPEFLDAIHEAGGDTDLAINQGVAENLIKLHQMALLNKGLVPLSKENDAVTGLAQPKLDELVKDFPAHTPERPNEFDYPSYELGQVAMRHVLDNDLYNFKVAAGFFGEGMHETHESSFSLFSRGKKNRAFMLTGGQELVVDMLQNLRFSEREINYLRQHPDFAHVKPEFFDYLRDFKFTGTVRSVKTGSVIFPNEPILEVTANPVEAQIVETLILPIINAVSTTATKAARVVEAANGRPVVEGGTRRGFNALLSSLGAFIGGVKGTSNAHSGRLFGIPTFGTMNHSWVEHFKDEIEAFTAYRKYFPETSYLVDNYDIERGVKNAVIAAGKTLKGVRLDSTISRREPDGTVRSLDKEETARVVRGILDRLGYQNVPITYSDGLDEYELGRIRNAPFQIALVGTEIAAPSDNNGMNVVYKLVERKKKDGGRESDPIKVANGKVGVPGQKQIFRFRDAEGKITRDIVAEAAEPTPARAQSLLEVVMENGTRTIPRLRGVDLQRHAAEELQSLPPELRALEKTPEKPYPVSFSEQLLSRQVAALDAHKKPARERIGVIPLSADPLHDAHLRMALRAKELYDLDRVIFVPTGDNPAPGVNKRYLFSAKERAAIVKRNIKDHAGLEIYEGEVEGRTRYTIDTLEDMKARGVLAPGSEVFIIGGELASKVGGDAAKNLPRWNRAQDLVDQYNWIITQRKGQEMERFPIDPSLLTRHRRLDDRHYVSPQGKTLDFVDLNLSDAASSLIKARYQSVQDVFHQVDTQKTFWKGMHGETDGPLALEGTPAITANIARLNRLAYGSDHIKSIASVDYHHEPEVGHPPHAIVAAMGAMGPDRIRESEVYPPGEQMAVPHRGPGKKDVAYELDSVADHVRDPRVEIVLQKDSYDVFANPRTEEIYRRIAPKRVVVYGVATDFCVGAAAEGLLKRGYEVLIVTDAVTGVSASDSAAKLAALASQGARLVTTDEVMAMYQGKGCKVDFASL